MADPLLGRPEGHLHVVASPPFRSISVAMFYQVKKNHHRNDSNDEGGIQRVDFIVEISKAAPKFLDSDTQVLLC